MSSNVFSNKTRNRRRNNEEDKVPLFHKMENKESVALPKLKNKKFSGELFYVNISKTFTSYAQTKFNLFNTIQSSSAHYDDENFNYKQKIYLDLSEDVLAHESNFDGESHVPFIYTSSEDKKNNFSDFEDDNQKNLTGDEANFNKNEYVIFFPLTWLRRLNYSLKGDVLSILLLLLLYLLQGVPLGLIAAIPLILQNKNVTYGQQAIFSFAYWPFSIKLLWAPIVDSLYFKSIGRRKSWMVPCQYLIGIFLLVISYFVPEILGKTEQNENGNKPPNVIILMSIFLPLNFLASTQDIAVDGWALTMLSRKNVGYASTCNVVGQTIGFFLGNVVFLTLQSKEFANKYFRSVPKENGLVGFDSFVFFWGWVFLITTTAVLILKREVDHSVIQQNKVDNISLEQSEEKELSFSVIETYKILAKILCLKPMILIIVVFLTSKIGFAAVDGMTDLKLIAAGISTDKIASRSIFLMPLQIVLPWTLGKYTSGSKPLNVFLWAYPYRLVMGILFAALVYWTPYFRETNGEYSYVYYVIWLVVNYLYQVSSYCIFLSLMSFNAQISDPKIGGTYMTLLNTLNNLSGNWPVTLFLSITDNFNRKNCVSKGTKIILGTCNSKHDEELCKLGGDICEFFIDGYYISVVISTVIGLIWYKIFYNKIQYFQKIPKEEWRVIKN